MKKLKFIFDDEEEEEEKFGWEQRTRGIGELPKLEIPKSTKLKFTADMGAGAGVKADIGVTLPEAEKPPAVGVTQRMRGIGEPPEKYPFEGITVDLAEANKKRSSLWWSELQTTEDKWKFLKHENWSPELQEADLEAMRLEEQASKMGVNTGDWIEYGVYATFFTAMAAGILPILEGLPRNILNKLTYKVEDRFIKGKELFNAIRRVRYPDPRAGFGKPSTLDKKIFAKFVEDGGVKSLAERMGSGVNIPKVTPRFAFGAKLYGGLPADAIVKSLVETGKIGAEISKELSVSTPEKVSQVIQNLNIASPAIASKLASELDELKPQKTFVGKAYRAETFIPEHGAEIIAKMKTAQEKLDYDALTTGNPVFREVAKLTERAGIDLGKVPVKEMVWVAKDLKVAQKYGDAKEIPIPEDTIILMEDDEGGSLILKNADKYREPVTVGLEEEAKVEALWAGKPEEPAEIPKVEGKAPWEMTREEFINDFTKKATKGLERKATDPQLRVLIDHSKMMSGKFHKEYVAKALTKGKPVPPEVLADYPKLKVKVKPPVEPVIAKPVPKPAPKPEVKREVVKPVIEKVELATPAQKAEAHILAKEHKIITKTPSGKISDLRYKRLAKAITGKTSIKNMTKEEADEFIESIKSIVQRRPWEPPIIPLSTKIVPKEFFEIEFKEPGLAKIITPKKYYLRILGAEPLLKDLTDSKELLTLKMGEINKWVNDVIRKINKEATIAHKFKARIFNRPTDKVATMRDLLDKYEEPPGYLKPKEKEIFKEVRDFTKDMLIRTNEVRDRVGLEPIKEIKTYIPHFLDELAKQIVNKKYPFPEDIKYWLGRNMPKKVYNPTAMERRVRDDLEKFFSKDLGALLRTLAKYDLRDIYLSEPYSILRAELNALGDKIPASTRKEIDLFLRHDIFNYPTELDQMLNKTLEKPTDIINFFLKPFNRTISNPISSLSNVYRQGLMGGAIAMKVRLVLRNLLTQKLLNINIYPIKDYLKAQFWLTPKGVMDEIRDTTFYKLSIRKFEDLPPLLKPIQWGMYPYSKSHAGINYISNVDVSGKVGYYYGEDMIAWCETTKGKAYIEKYAKKHNLTGKAKDDLVWRKGDEKDEAVEAMSVTQWLYFSTDMPRVFRGKGARAFWSLQSWWMNWFGKHLREGLIRMGGKTSRGRIVRPGDRINFIKGLAVIFALTEAIRMKTGIDMKRFLFFPFPAYIYPPAMQLILNTYYLVTAKTDQKRKSAISGLKNNLKLLIPFSGAWRRYWQFIKGEITLKEWLFYMERKKKGQPPLKITVPKKGKLKFTKPELKIESKKLKFTF